MSILLINVNAGWIEDLKQRRCPNKDRKPICVYDIKGTVSRDFLLQVFFMNHLPQAPENNIRIISIFFENSRRYSQVKVHHRCQRHGGKFATNVNDTGGKLPPVSTTPAANLPPVPLVLLTPVANLPLVSTTPVANCHRYQRHWRQIRHRCRWHRWQIMGTISGCRHLKVNLKAEIYRYVNLLPKGSQTKLLKVFWLKIFSICHRCRRHRWCTLSRENLCEFSKKFEIAVKVYSDAWGKLIHEKNQKSKVSWHCPFKQYNAHDTKLKPNFCQWLMYFCRDVQLKIRLVLQKDIQENNLLSFLQYIL